jgi:hypothetical protein
VASRAAETIEQTIIDGNVAASLAVLKVLGFLSDHPAPIGSEFKRISAVAAMSDWKLSDHAELGKSARSS